MTQHMSARGRAFLASWEGLRTQPYNDSADNATVGIGHLIHYGPVTGADLARYRGFTRADAYKLLAQDLGSYEQTVRSYIHRDMSQWWFDAFTDLVYNCGPGALAGSVGQLFNGRQWGRAADAMLAWSHAGGAFSPGLYRRRRAEWQLAVHHVYNDN